MIYLLRNCSHGSEFSTYLFHDGLKEKKIVKSATTPAGIDSLRREHDGYVWYQKIRYPERTHPMCRITHEAAQFMRIEIEYIKGTKGDYRKKMESNDCALEMLIRHYCDVWPYYVNRYSHLHGDLSLGNTIYNSDGVHIIDWEHFKLNAVPWGFDATYLLLETLWFSMAKGKRSEPSEKEIEIIATKIEILASGGRLERVMLEQPLRFIINFIRQNGTLWGIFPKKIPIVLFSGSQINRIDKLICSRLASRGIL